MKNQRLDDIRTEVTINAITREGTSLPNDGDTITYTGLKQIGWKYDQDSRGYAILHTATPWEVKDEPRQYKVASVKPGLYYEGFSAITITGYSLKTTIE